MVLKEKGHFEIPRRRWDINIQTDLTAIEWEGVDCIKLAWDRDTGGLGQ
jgi:hypothetical protein